jgi:exonuclease III
MTKNGFIDLFHELNPSLRDNDTATCRFDTRIDFVWVSQPLFQLIDLERSQCTIMSEVDISDHSPVHTILFVK